jgi:hypothetical protein
MTRYSERHFDWDRYVARRGATVSIDPDGFLVDNALSEVLTLSQTSDTAPVVVLFGMPGAGKSRSLQGEFQRRSTLGGASEPSSRWFDLSQFSTDTRLVETVFHNHRLVANRASHSAFALFLDSLDECQLSVKTVAKLLATELRAIYWPGLQLCVSCRSAVWPLLLEKELGEIWPKDAVSVVELQPLRRADVVTAARDLGVDAEKFLKEITRLRAGAFAARPVTLKLLLNLYQRSEALPKRRRDVYAQGLRTLVDELSDSRRASGHTGSLTIQSRLDVAAAVSAVSVFCNRSQIWVGASSECPEECVSLDDLADFSTRLGFGFQSDHREAVAEVLDTSLYSGHGPSRVAIAHESYREYLGADFLVKHCHSRSQLISLIVNVHDPERKIAPQLFGVAAWLYELSQEVRDYIDTHQPELILQSDVDLDPEVPREPLVEAIMRLASAWQYIDMDWSSRDRYYKLTCEGLPRILSSYITDKAHGFVARRIAIDIAEACNDHRLLQDLILVATDVSDAVEIREQAAFAISHLNTALGRDCLQTFIERPEETEASDDLIGIALNALWPIEISSDQVFKVVRAPRQSLHHGAYAQFIGSRLPHEIAAVDLIPALRWLGATASASPDFSVDRLQRAILDRALRECEKEVVRVALADAVWRHMQVYSQIFERNAREHVAWSIKPPETRRELLLEIARTAQASSIAIGIGMVATSRLGVLREEDFEFLLNRYEECQPGVDRQVLAQLLSRVVNFMPSEHQLNIILERGGFEVPERDEGLAAVFRWIVDPMWLGSSEVEQARDHLRLRKEWEVKREPVKLDPPPDARVRLALEKIESGDLEWFPVLLAQLTLEESSLVYGHIGSAIFTQPGWLKADSVTRDRIASAALSFIQNYAPKPETSTITNQWQSSDESPMVALYVVCGYAPDLCNHITEANWANIFVPLMCVPTWDEKDDRVPIWLNRAYNADEKAGLALVADRLRLALQDPPLLDTFRKLNIIWSESLATLSIDILRQAPRPTYGFVELLKCLVVHDRELGLSFAMELLSDRSRDERRPAILSLLLRKSLADRWDAIWPLIETNDDLAKSAFLEQQTSEESLSSQFSRLSVDKLSQMYARLERLFPSSSDPHLDGYVTSRHTVARVRDAALHVLRQRGTFEAVREISRLSVKFPDSQVIRLALVDAKQLARAATWETPTGAEFVELLGDSRKRLVRDSRELSSIILETMDRLQRHVQGPNKPASQYWDERSGDQRPKSETRLAEYVRAFLELSLRDTGGVMVNREVEIRNLSGAGVGERVDLLVSATSKTMGVVDVVVECKGCWNPGLFEDMEGQLRDRYLQSVGYSEGIYLVGWFLCPRWSSEDPRRSNSEALIRAMSLLDLRAKFEEQARVLSFEGCNLASYVIDLSLRRDEESTPNA